MGLYGNGTTFKTDWRNPTAVLFGAINPKEGELIIYNEYYVAGKTLPEHAKVIKPLIEEIPHGLIRYMVIDPATKQRTNPIEGKSVQTHLQEYGMFFQAGNNALDYGIAKVGSYIELKKLKIYRTCTNLIKEAISYKYPELDMDNFHENQDEKPIKANDHAMDSLRYMIARLPDDPHRLKNEAYEPPKSYRNYNSYETLEYEYNDDDEDNQVKDYMAYY